MNRPDAALHYPLDAQVPQGGQTLELLPGLLWLRMPLPFALDHINLWLIRDHMDTPTGRLDGWTLVDCGVNNEVTRQHWVEVFTHALQGLPLLRVMVTHMHPDHIGCADWLTTRWQCPMWVSASDFLAAHQASTRTTGFGGEAAALHFARHGLQDPESMAQIRARANYYPSMVPQVPSSYQRILHGDRIRIGEHEWQAHVGYGHAPEHMSFHCPALEVLISGDMVLPRISTNVSVIDLEPEGNPLPLYLQSLAQMRLLPAQTLVLPSHGKPFTGLHTRIDQLMAHHQERFAEVRLACQTPQSAADIVPVLFKRQLDLHQMTFAMGEAIAHLHALWRAGELQRHASADGVWRFTTKESALL
jgi:glyoxylase-like metal-dependent hydrolase (beta-lactamase superfamily II)